MKRKISVIAASLAVAIVLTVVPKLRIGTVRADASEADTTVEEVQIEINATNFPDANFRKYVTDYFDFDTPKGVLTQNEISYKLDINCAGKDIKSLKGIEFFTELQELRCFMNDLDELDISKNTKLTYLDCSDNPSLTKLVTNGAISLEELNCSKCSLNELNVSKNTKLKILKCYLNSSLTKLVVKGASSLEKLECYDTGITTLDLSGNQKLKYMDCGDCSLTEIDLGVHPYLTAFYCYRNKITSLDFSGCPALDLLYCYNNNISVLNVANSPKLRNFHCDNNPITKIDVSSCPYLVETVQKGSRFSVSGTSSGHYREYIEYQYYVELADGTTIFCTLDVDDGDHVYTEIPTYNVTVTTDGHGTATASVTSGTEGTEVSLSASPKSGYKFKKWQVVSGNVTISGNKFKIAEADVKIKAIFEPITRTVTVITDGNGKATASAASGIIDDTVTLSATPNDGYRFKQWQIVSGGVTIKNDAFAIGTADVKIKAIFEPITRTVTVTSDGNGTATASAASGIIGDTVTLSATPDDGYRFKEWQVISGGVTIENNTFVIGTADVEIKAVFEAVPTNPDPDEPTPEPGPDTPTPEPGPDTPTPEPQPDTPTPEPQPDTPTPTPEKEPSFEDFVERLYVVALGRPSEAEGKAFWVEQVVKNGFTGADCARFFMLGAPEFLGRNLTDDEFVEVLYKTYFDRDSEPDGKAYWLGRLASGTERAVLVEEFIESVEWCNVCATYGVKSGAQWHKATIASKNAIKFATRLYTCCLGRDPEEEGLKYWSLALTNLDATGYQAASMFFTLPEFVGLNTTNEEYLTRLYKTFMGREPEADGFNYWLGLLNGGTDRNDVMRAFAGCPEFQEICNQYGIDRGEI